jgi:hypothetical protein
MELEFVGKPDVVVHSRLVSERVKVRGRSGPTKKSITGETRAMVMEVDGLTVEAFVTIGPDNRINLGLASFKTLNVLDDGRVGKEINFAVQTDAGEVLSLREQIAVEPAKLDSNADVISFIKSAMDRHHASAGAKRPSRARTSRPKRRKGGIVKGVDSVALFTCLFFQPELTILCVYAAAEASAAAAARNGDEELVTA